MKLLVGGAIAEINPPDQEYQVPSYLAGFAMSNRALITLSDALRARRSQVGGLSAGRQALLVLAHLRKGETYADLATGFGIGTTAVFR